MYSNNIIELFKPEVQQILYAALEQNKNIMYTRNLRSTPIRTKTGIENVYITEINNKTYTIVIEPDKKQLEYFDYKIINIESAIKEEMELQELIDFLKDNSKIVFINTLINSQFNFLSQYRAESVYSYINSLKVA